MRVALVIVLLFSSLFAYRPKTPSDVFSYAMLLKQKVIYLRKKAKIDKPFPQVPPQHNKYPRHVIQKALEILSKINLYRISKGYGEIAIPVYPTREITPTDVYEMVKRLDAEVTPLIRGEAFLNSLHFVHYSDKTPNDVYRLLWSISLAFDDLLGIHGYTPSDVYALSLKLIDNAKFLRQSQNIFAPVQKPVVKEELHPNHALYASYDFTAKVRKAQINLWIKNPTEVPQKPHRVIIPTDVYDSIQYNLAELQRIKYRLGLERYFKIKEVQKNKTPSDVVANIRYAIKLLPLFDFHHPLVQHPKKALQKTPNHVYAVTQEILKKIAILKNLRGIQESAKEPPYIYGLRPIHAYQKSLEAIEKALRLKEQMGFYPSQVPSAPLRPITPNEVYENALRLDGIITILLRKLGYKSDEYVYKLNKTIPIGKKPSDVYHNFWHISNELDLLLASAYTPNETYMLAHHIWQKMTYIAKALGIRPQRIDKIAKMGLEVGNKSPADVFAQTIELFGRIKQLQKRLNIQVANIIIPKEKSITPNSVYNALRILNAAVNEIIIYHDIDIPDRVTYNKEVRGKTPEDVYELVKKIELLVASMYDESAYKD